MSPIVVSVESIIGAGKSQLLELFKNDSDVCCIFEPVDEWSTKGILQEFYDALQSKKNNVISLTSYKFQTFTFISRIKRILKVYKEKPDAKIYLLERSIFSDRYFFVEMLHDEKYFSDKEYDMYKEWWDLWETIMPFKINGFIYLTPTVDTAMHRLRHRNRDGETTISNIYQENLKKYHDIFFNDENVKCLKIDTTDIDYKNDDECKEYIKKMVYLFINSL